jgi:hypothetical protein
MRLKPETEQELQKITTEGGSLSILHHLLARAILELDSPEDGALASRKAEARERKRLSVIRMQELLGRWHEFYEGPIEGIFGPATEAALQEWVTWIKLR